MSNKTPQDVINHILLIEGEKYTNDPRDSGGPTKWGVTQRSYSNFMGRQVSESEIKGLTRQQAFDFYWKKHYTNPNFDKIYAISPLVGAEVIDAGVNMGEARAGMILQECLNAFNLNGTKYPDLRVDGAIGGASIDCLTRFLNWRGREGESVLHAAMNCKQGAFYLDLAERRPKDEAFAYGWILNRVLR